MTDNLTCGCGSHSAAAHQGACGHCGAPEDEFCRPGCPVDGIPDEPELVDPDAVHDRLVDRQIEIAEHKEETSAHAHR